MVCVNDTFEIQNIAIAGLYFTHDILEKLCEIMKQKQIDEALNLYSESYCLLAHTYLWNAIYAELNIDPKLHWRVGIKGSDVVGIKFNPLAEIPILVVYLVPAGIKEE